MPARTRLVHARRPAGAGATDDPTEGLDRAEIRRSLLAWYEAEGRRLPFRDTGDPWAVLVSEAMAQQTQAARAATTWRAFMAEFPTPAALAAATPAAALRAWRGLGYNRRAINLQRAAGVIEARHAGRVPNDLAALEALPGVGPYTARAVAAIAFGMPTGAVDTNVRRVLGRLVGDDGSSRRAIQALADALVDPARPGDWTHALMDVGATRCRPARADCGHCPLVTWCRSAGTDPRGSRSGRVPSSEPPFPATARWLRGRIVERLRDAAGPGWVRIEVPIGVHGEAAVAASLAGLDRDGLVERHPSDPLLARLPVALG